MTDYVQPNIYPQARTSTAWQRLTALAKQSWSITALFADSPKRAEHFCVTAASLYMDYSKQCVDDEVMQALFALADSCDLQARIDDLLQGAAVNSSEQRPALHTALRLPKDAKLTVAGTDVVNDVHESLDQVERLANRIREGTWRGFSGKAITDVVNIGVGGSDLGPLMVTSALDDWADTDIAVHFVSNMDGSQLDNVLKRLSPETTVFIISSKSFSTVDTLSNAETARTWLFDAAKLRLGSDDSVLRRHFIGISTHAARMCEWGIHPENQLKFWEWVGGRFSLWSAIGLTVAVRIGMDNFRALLAGAHNMDEHFATTSFDKNLPVILGLLAVWNSSFLDIHAHTVLPYDGRLHALPSYLTQLEMESNGKSVTHQGDTLDHNTCPILWGEVGSNAQHAFYQLLHQGTQQVSCDFIACVAHYHHQASAASLQYQHQLALANCLAQSRVLAFGNASEQQGIEADSHKHYRGNQPSTTLLLDALTPYSLGALIALYEHKVYVMASIWDVNPFDQWGVEMGKAVATSVHHVLAEQAPADFDASTNALLRHIQQYQNGASTAAHKE